jgi:hypothetical protein
VLVFVVGDRLAGDRELLRASLRELCQVQPSGWREVVKLVLCLSIDRSKLTSRHVHLLLIPNGSGSVGFDILVKQIDQRCGPVEGSNIM